MELKFIFSISLIITGSVLLVGRLQEWDIVARPVKFLNSLPAIKLAVNKMYLATSLCLIIFGIAMLVRH